MTSMGYTSSALIRQSTEARYITDKCNVKLMNRKGEWGQNLPPKLTLEDDRNGDKDAQDQGQRQGAKRQRSDKTKEDERVADECIHARKKIRKDQEPPSPGDGDKGSTLTIGTVPEHNQRPPKKRATKFVPMEMKKYRKISDMFMVLPRVKDQTCASISTQKGSSNSGSIVQSIECQTKVKACETSLYKEVNESELSQVFSNTQRILYSQLKRDGQMDQSAIVQRIPSATSEKLFDASDI